MANLTGNLKDSMTATFPREFDIPNAMTIQEIYDKLNARAAAFQMPFSVKGGIPGEHREVELGGIISCQVAVFQPRNYFWGNLDEFFLSCYVLVFYAVYLAGSRIYTLLLSGSIVPRANPPSLHFMVMVREYFHETQFHDSIRRDIQSCTFDIEKQERLFKIQIHVTSPL